MPRFSHLDEKGKARMVDVSGKDTTRREAVARGKVLMKPQTAQAIEKLSIAKGDVLAVAKIAGVMAGNSQEYLPYASMRGSAHVDRPGNRNRFSS